MDSPLSRLLLKAIWPKRWAAWTRTRRFLSWENSRTPSVQRTYSGRRSTAERRGSEAGTRNRRSEWKKDTSYCKKKKRVPWNLEERQTKKTTTYLYWGRAHARKRNKSPMDPRKARPTNAGKRKRISLFPRGCNGACLSRLLLPTTSCHFMSNHLKMCPQTMMQFARRTE